MKELFRSVNDGYDDMSRDAISYTRVMNAWAECRLRAASRKAKEILRHMRDLRDAVNLAAGTDTVSSNTALKAWELSGKEGAVQRKEEILHII